MANIPGKTTDEIFMDDLKQEFLEGVPMMLKNIHRLYDEGDYAGVAKIAHNIKGTAGAFDGLDEGSEIADELLYSIKDGKIEEAKKIIDKLTEYMRKHGADI